eukprot:2834772-Heterocapsa_arctica.AAC.1
MRRRGAKGKLLDGEGEVQAFGRPWVSASGGDVGVALLSLTEIAVDLAGCQVGGVGAIGLVR